MRKIRLTERDLNRLVKRVINEMDDDVDIFAKASMTDRDTPYYDQEDFETKFTDDEMDETKTFGPDEYDDFMEYINNCDTKWCIKTKRFYDMYTEKGSVTVGKKFK